MTWIFAYSLLYGGCIIGWILCLLITKRPQTPNEDT